MSAAAKTTITLFHNPRCSTSRNAAKLLEAEAAIRPFHVETIEYLKEPLTKDQIRDILGFLHADINPAVLKEFLRKDAPPAETVAKVQQILAQDPAMLQRPLVVNWAEKKAVIGRPAEAVLDIFKDL